MTDFVSGLRADLMEAALRQEHAAARTRRRLSLGARPALALAAALMALAVLGVLLSRVPREAQPARLKVTQELHIGGMPQDAVLAGGDLWVLDFHDGVRRVTGGERRLATPSGASMLASGDGLLWALGQRGRAGYWLVGGDVRTGRAMIRRDRSGYPMGLAVGATGLWVAEAHDPARVLRLDGRSVALPSPAYIAAGGGTVWALADELGSLYAVDESTDRLVLNLHGVVDPIGSPGSGGHLLAADRRGVWIGDPGHDRVVRVTRRGVERRISVGPLPGPIALRGRTLWVATGDPERETYQLKRVDLRTGEVGDGISLGSHAPEALAPFAGGCWVVAADGTALKVVAG